MIHLPMAKLMSKHCHNLLIVATSCFFLLSLALLFFFLLFLLSFLLSFFISLQFHPFRFFQQCVKENNPLEPDRCILKKLSLPTYQVKLSPHFCLLEFDPLEESVEVGVAVAGPLAALNHIELVQWELNGGSEAFNLKLETDINIKFKSKLDYLHSCTCPFSSPSGIGVYLSKSGAMRSG